MLSATLGRLNALLPGLFSSAISFHPARLLKAGLRAIRSVFVNFFSFFVYFFTIPDRSIISKSTGSIFAKFSGLAELYTAVDDQSEVIFFNPSRDVAVTSFCRLYPHN